ncbi:MAG: translocation/assembly module TamB domain-containing protein [candidate division Zixibacteria bacterium]|nr:translocation/assembly module TamB domain-containing protein [candidate division Zixibacteria bacterium]
MRLFGKIIFYLFCFFLLSIIGLWVYFIYLGGMERMANSKLEAMLAGQPDIKASIGKVNGNLISGLNIEDVEVYYDDGTIRYLMLEIPHLEIVYSLSNLLYQQYSFDYLSIDSAAVTIVRDSTERWLIPPFNEDTVGSASGEQSLKFQIDNFALNQARLRIVDSADTILVDDILLWSAIEVNEDTYAVEMERLEFTSNQERISLDAADGKLTYANGNALFHDINLISGETMIQLSGRVTTKDSLAGKVNVVADNVDLETIAMYIGPHLRGVLDVNAEVSFIGARMQGTANIAGDFMMASFDNLHLGFRYADKQLNLDTLYGSILGGCSIDGCGNVDFSKSTKEYHLSTDIRGFNLKKLVSHGFESNLNGRISLDGNSFRKEDMELAIHTELYESSFDQYPIQKASGDIIVTIDSIAFVDSFSVNYFENELYASGKVSYHDGMSLKIFANLNNLDRYQGKFFIDKLGGRGYAEVAITGKTSDPNLRGFFVSDSVWIYDIFSDSMFTQVDVARFLTGKKGEVTAQFYDGQAWNIPFDTGYAQLKIDSNLVSIDSLFFTNPSVQLEGKGIYDYGSYPQQLQIDTLNLNLWDRQFYNSCLLDIEIDSGGFIFNRMEIENTEAQLSVQGKANYDETLDLRLSLEKVPLPPWVNLFDTTYKIDGFLSCDVTMNGSIDEPIFNLSGRIDSLTYKDLELGDLAVTAAYSDNLLTLNSGRLVSDRGEYLASGYIHSNLALTSNHVERFPDLPMDINITASDKHFDLVSFLMPSVEYMTGDFSADFRLSGTPNNPHIDGEAYLKNGSLKYFGLEHPIFTDSAGATMHDNRIIIDDIELYTTENKKPSGQHRYALVEGEIEVQALDTFYYDLNVTLPEEFPFTYELDDISGKIEGEFNVKGSSPPLVTGSLTLISILYQSEFAQQDEGSPFMLALSGDNEWDLNINVDILSNYWIKNEDIDAEFAGKLNMIRENGVYRFIGEMEILRGRGFLFDKTFSLEPGSRIIFEGNDTLNPRLDITGYTHIAGVVEDAFEENTTRETIELCIDIGGTLELPEINPCEGSDFSREDILPLIVANYYARDGFSSSSQIEQRLFDMGYTQVSQIGARQLSQIGVETFEINPVYGEELDSWNARVTVGFYTNSGIYLYGKSTLAGQTRQEIGFDYRLNKAFQIEGRRDEEELYHLNLKFHWEF